MRSHSSVVMRNAIELSGYADDPISLILAAQMHDIGIPYTKGRKIVESEIAQAYGDKRIELERLAIEYRMEHMALGVEMAKEVLIDLRIDEGVIDRTLDLIKYHDMWKLNKHYMYSNDGLLLCDADVLWVWSSEGIDRDIERATENGLEVLTRKEQFEYNKSQFYWRLSSHGKIIFKRYEALVYEEKDLECDGACKSDCPFCFGDNENDNDMEEL